MESCLARNLACVFLDVGNGLIKWLGDLLIHGQSLHHLMLMMGDCGRSEVHIKNITEKEWTRRKSRHHGWTVNGNPDWPFFEVNPSTSTVSGVFPINLDHWASHIVGVYSHSGTAPEHSQPAINSDLPEQQRVGFELMSVEILSQPPTALTTTLCCFGPDWPYGHFWSKCY